MYSLPTPIPTPIPVYAQHPRFYPAVQTRRHQDIELSRTILDKHTMAPYFPQFVATFIHSVWHDYDFATLTNYPTNQVMQFTQFCQELLRVTQLPFCVVILALKYIHRIKIRCADLQGRPGSEYRLFVCTLNLAMKYLVDNTYSNKTWHKLSKIPLLEINMAEMEFMQKLNYDLHVDNEKYFAWLWTVDDAFAKFRAILDMTMARQCLTPPLEYPDFKY